jgi:CRP/FNR family transcriptional regulator, cyclic AMP receptor protein
MVQLGLGVWMNDLTTTFDRPVKFNAGHVIFAEGEPSSYLYIVVSGEISIFKEGTKRLIPISVVRDKDFIGELSMFSDEPRSATAIATTDSELMMIKKADIRKVMKECPDWITNFMITISDRLRSTVEILRDHNIVDDLADDLAKISSDDQKGYIKSIKEYKARRGIK